MPTIKRETRERQIMARDPRYDILFEPVKIGPVTAPNRFYQVPHCTGLGWLRPRMLADMRGTKAEGGWGVVCTEFCSIHPMSDNMPSANASLWNDADIKSHALMTERVHAHGSLAGVELWFGGAASSNRYSRLVPMDVVGRCNSAGEPVQTRAMDKQDIRDIRRWHRKAALRAKQAGFDIVYVYAAHGYLMANFMDPRINTRTDEYGGSLENRVRLVRELIEETKDAIGDTCAVAVRISAEAGGGEDGDPVIGERSDVISMLAELPDLWDVTIRDYTLEMGVSRFVPEGSLEPYVAHVKSLTTKPVVSVGRFTSPDAMVSQVRRGVLDLIGAARPSIADPFLPRKIEQGRLEDIRECIGCNICFAGHFRGGPAPCTQNPTMGEEWRLGWHPERMQPGTSDARVLVVGAGPAGLEAARALGNRGYHVMLAEASDRLGGRVTQESALPGLSAWSRVRDYREQQILRMPNVEVFLESRLDAEDVIEVGASSVVVATGAVWRRDGIGPFASVAPAVTAPANQVFTPDDLMSGTLPEGRVLIYDDHHYYMASVLAERLLGAGRNVVFATPGDSVMSWGNYTEEADRNRRRLHASGAEIVTAHLLESYCGESATLGCVYSDRIRKIDANAVVLVTSRTPVDDLYLEVSRRVANGAAGPVSDVAKIGDCDAPGLIVHAVRAGHRYAREFDEDVDRDEPMRHDRVFDGLD